MISRRRFQTMAVGAVATGLGLNSLPALAATDAAKVTASDPYAAVLTSDGNYTQPWFLDSFLEFSDDLEEATSSGKRFAIMWELDGCPYCRETHLVNFAVPEIQDYVSANFEIIQMNLIGSREITDFDGKGISEKKLALKNKVRFTPTIQFFPETLAEVKASAGPGGEVARMPGYFKPFYFLTMFQFVKEKEYENQDFRKYLKNRILALRSAGKSLPSW